MTTKNARIQLTIIHRSNGARAGEVIGLLINGFVSERFGYRKTMIGALIAMTGFIFILFFAPNVQTLVIGEVFCGIPWGMYVLPIRERRPAIDKVQVSNIDNPICFRGCTCATATNSNDFRQHVGIASRFSNLETDFEQVLGHGSIHCSRRQPSLRFTRRPVGVPNSVRYSMDLANSNCDWSRPRSRVTLVACS